MQHQPKGSMCMACAKKLEDCSKLPFDKMRPIEKMPDAIIVICSEFIKNDHQRSASGNRTTHILDAVFYRGVLVAD